jgi:ssDNA-binding Zn-finger/Zn-ribbon topoisomerase 1
VTESALPRETGAEKAGRTCPNCGTQMQVTETSYGSLVAVCPKCSDQSQLAPQTASEASTTTPRVTGTTVEPQAPASTPEGATNG